MWITQLTPTLGNAISSVQFSRFVTPWTVPHQASLSITSSRSSLRPMCIESVMPSNHLILCHMEAGENGLTAISAILRFWDREAWSAAVHGVAKSWTQLVREQQPKFLRPSFLNSEMGQYLSPQALADSQVLRAAIWAGGTLRILAYVFKPWRY